MHLDRLKCLTKQEDSIIMVLADATGVRGDGSGAVRGAGGQARHAGDAGNDSRYAHRGSVLSFDI